jgi:hypothetical protein
MPGKREEPFMLYLLYRHFPSYVLIAWVGNLAARDLMHKGAIQFYLKPFAELTIVSQRKPDPGDRCLEFNALFDAILHKQPASCL